MSRTTLLIAATFLSLTLVFPGAFAQFPSGQSAISDCSEMCDPREANGNTIATGQTPVKTILYAHCPDTLSRCPLNAQELGKDDPDVSGGTLVPTFVTDAPGSCGNPNFCFVSNWYYWWLSAGLVEAVGDGHRRDHPEPGLAERLLIGDEQPFVFFYISVDEGQFVPGGAGIVSVDGKTTVGVYARFETGRTTRAGQLVMEGDSGNTATPAGELVYGNAQLINQDGGRAVYEFKVPMTVAMKELPDVKENDAGFLMSINVYQIRHQDASPSGKWQLTTNDFRVHYGKDYPARLVLQIKNPMVTKSSSLTLFQDALFIRWGLISPWGSYDADDRTLKIDITGPTAMDKTLMRNVLFKRILGHGGHFKPINVTWRYEYTKAGLADGEYTVTASLTNLQNTYELREQLKFTVAGGQITDVQQFGTKGNKIGAQSAAGESPSVGASMLLMAIVGAVFVAYRRRQA